MTGRKHLRRPSPAALAQLCDAVAPGSRPANVRRLRGGLDAAMHTVDLVDPGGARRRLVVRRPLEHRPGRATAMTLRSWQTLRALEALGVPAPRPVWLDLDGAIFGTPAFVMTRLPGRGLLRPHDLEAWTRQLAEALAALHRALPAGRQIGIAGRFDLSFLAGPEERLEEEFCWAMQRTEDAAAHADNAAVRATLQRWRPRLRRMTPVLTHGDYWAGNTLWRRGRLTGVVDWDMAAIGYPGLDVGYCRMDLAMLVGPQAAALFLRAYEAAAGWHIPQLFIWDLLGAARALPDPERWLPCYYDLGRTEITANDMRSRLHAFIADALARAG